METTSFTTVSDLFFFGIPDLSVDAMDVSGEHQLDVDHSIFKKRLSASGMSLPIGPEMQQG